MSLPMVTRAEWGAMPPCHTDPLRPPVTKLGFVHTASLACHDREECIKMMRFMQRCHMGKHKMADMKHNFYISTDGTIYEGRGWMCNTSNYDPYYNNDYIDMKGKFITIARIGLDFNDNPLTPEELAAKAAIIKYGLEQKYLAPNYQEIEGMFYQLFGNSNPPEQPPYEVWTPPPCSQRERFLLYNCTSNSEWKKQLEQYPEKGILLDDENEQ